MRRRLRYRGRSSRSSYSLDLKQRGLDAGARTHTANDTCHAKPSTPGLTETDFQQVGARPSRRSH
ncbi:hypothetical protein LC55x_4613 [Lysobacter capsici]|nr:hypothetical protein LC55x_4613 [Lysobacter capsici]